ncbi:hypothetical protein IW261DRAFT_1517745, partial [Armillaria novae-zelandiae]
MTFRCAFLPSLNLLIVFPTSDSTTMLLCSCSLLCIHVAVIKSAHKSTNKRSYKTQDYTESMETLQREWLTNLICECGNILVLQRYATKMVF